MLHYFSSTTCTWCGRRVRADTLEAHYWRRCVLLARCPHCRVALEARVLHVHLLGECFFELGSHPIFFLTIIRTNNLLGLQFVWV